jgi:peroxiredoxin
VDDFTGRTVRDEGDGRALIRARLRNHPKAGEAAPDFELDRHDGSGRVRLSSFRGDRPVVLIFGSIT